MKKKLFPMGLFVLLLTLFTGCSNKSESLRICVDLAYVEETAEGINVKTAMEGFLVVMKSSGGPEDVEVEYVPASGSERETALDRLRTEIMSGGGPDVFILNCDVKSSFHTEEALFPIAERTIDQALFLPLDDYMENNAQYAEWDKMNEVVMAAGRNEEGQQIIPLSYTIPVSVYKQSEVTYTPSRETTWMEMLETEDEALAAAAVWTDITGLSKQGSPLMKDRDVLLEFILGDLADYTEEKLLFTEEELQQRFSEVMELADRYTQGEFDSAPLHYNDFLGCYFNQGMFLKDIDGTIYDTQNGITETDSLTLVPLYSDDGGVTASITAYTAINRNTTRPEDAFYIVDYLLSTFTQRTSNLYNFFLQNRSSIPIHDDLMSKDYPVGGALRWTLSDENFAALSAVRDQITSVRFQGGLEIELDAMLVDYISTKLEGNSTANIVSEYYKNMLRILAE